VANGHHQLDSAIADATNRLAREGWEDADLRLVMLATTGYLVHEIRKPPWLRLKTLVPLAGAAGAALATAAWQLFLRVL